jgi:hypothetical protein
MFPSSLPEAIFHQLMERSFCETDSFTRIVAVYAVNFNIHTYIHTYIHLYHLMNHVTVIVKSREISVGIALGYGLDDRGSRVRFLAGARNFSLHYRVQNGSGAHAATYQWVQGALFLGIKWQGREADHSSPSSAEVKECVEVYLQSPVPSWRCAQLKET